MSRTVKAEWSSPDGWHVCRRLERKARPAGRILALVEAELAAEGIESQPQGEGAMHKKVQFETAGAQRGAAVVTHYFGAGGGSLVTLLEDLAEYAEAIGIAKLSTLAVRAEQRVAEKKARKSGQAAVA